MPSTWQPSVSFSPKEPRPTIWEGSRTASTSKPAQAVWSDSRPRWVPTLTNTWGHGSFRSLPAPTLLRPEQCRSTRPRSHASGLSSARRPVCDHGPLPQADHGPLPQRADAPTDTDSHRHCAAVPLQRLPARGHLVPERLLAVCPQGTWCPGYLPAACPQGTWCAGYLPAVCTQETFAPSTWRAPQCRVPTRRVPAQVPPHDFAGTYCWFFAKNQQSSPAESWVGPLSRAGRHRAGPAESWVGPPNCAAPTELRCTR
jgi:hypothetical protein